MTGNLDESRLAGVDPNSRRDIWVKKLLYPAHTLPTAAAPVVVGVGLALHDDVFSLLPALSVLGFGLLVQVGGVLADNYFNLERYRNDEEHPALVQALETGVVELAAIKRATVVVFALAFVLGLYLAYLGGVPVIVVGLASGLVSLLYSLELSDYPLHDLYFFVFFGPVSVAGTYYVLYVASTTGPFPLWFPPGSFPMAAVLAGVPVGAITTAILVVDNIRDLDFDRHKDDLTLAVAIGERWGRVEYNALLAVAYGFPVVLWLGTELDVSVLLPVLSLPFAALVARRMARSRSYRELLPMSPRTGQVLLVYSLLLGAGLSL